MIVITDIQRICDSERPEPQASGYPAKPRIRDSRLSGRQPVLRQPVRPCAVSPPFTGRARLTFHGSPTPGRLAGLGGYSVGYPTKRERRASLSHLRGRCATRELTDFPLELTGLFPHKLQSDI